MDADGEIAQLKGALTKMSKDYDEYVDLSTEVEEGLHGELTLVREEMAKEKELLSLREGDFQDYRQRTEEFEGILIDQISTLKDELRRVTAEALGKDEEHQAAQASALATEDELRRVTAEALGKDEEHQAAQASALATEKVVREKLDDALKKNASLSSEMEDLKKQTRTEIEGLKEELANSRRLEIQLKDGMAELTRELSDKEGKMKEMEADLAAKSAAVPAAPAEVSACAPAATTATNRRGGESRAGSALAAPAQAATLATTRRGGGSRAGSALAAPAQAATLATIRRGGGSRAGSALAAPAQAATLATTRRGGGSRAGSALAAPAQADTLVTTRRGGGSRAGSALAAPAPAAATAGCGTRDTRTARSAGGGAQRGRVTAAKKEAELKPPEYFSSKGYRMVAIENFKDLKKNIAMIQAEKEQAAAEEAKAKAQMAKAYREVRFAESSLAETYQLNEADAESEEDILRLRHLRASIKETRDAYLQDARRAKVVAAEAAGKAAAAARTEETLKDELPRSKAEARGRKRPERRRCSGFTPELEVVEEGDEVEASENPCTLRETPRSVAPSPARGGARASSGRRAPGAAREEKEERRQTRAELAFVRHQRRMKERKKGAL